MTNLAVLLTIPRPFQEELAVYPLQGYNDNIYDSAPGAREVVLITATEEKLVELLAEFPQIKILTKHQLSNGKHAGLEVNVTYDPDTGVATETVTGTPNYTPDLTTLRGTLRAKRNIDENGVELPPTARVLEDDDLLSIWSMPKRVY